MIYLTGSTNDDDEPALIAAGIGLIVQPATKGYNRRISRYPWWAADNGCFADTWTEEPWLDWLDARPRDRCLFAVAPDVYADAVGSLDRGRRYFDLLREMGFPVAVVAQDGGEHLDYPWDDFDVMFLGGRRTPDPRDEWKTGAGAAQLAARARGHGKWVHMGRVNSLYRLEKARRMGCNSADGTCLGRRRQKRATDTDGIGERGGAELAAWAAWLRAHQPLPGMTPSEVHALAVHREASV